MADNSNKELVRAIEELTRVMQDFSKSSTDSQKSSVDAQREFLNAITLAISNMQKTQTTQKTQRAKGAKAAAKALDPSNIAKSLANYALFTAGETAKLGLGTHLPHEIPQKAREIYERTTAGKISTMQQFLYAQKLAGIELTDAQKKEYANIVAQHQEMIEASKREAEDLVDPGGGATRYLGTAGIQRRISRTLGDIFRGFAEPGTVANDFIWGIEYSLDSMKRAFTDFNYDKVFDIYNNFFDADMGF